MNDRGALLERAFSPHEHVDDEARFVGRVHELTRVRGVAAQRGLHLVIYGDPGTGKTSLALTGTRAHAPSRRLVVVCGKNQVFSDVCREVALQLVAAFPAGYEFDAAANCIRHQGASFPAAAVTRDVIRFLLPKGDDPLVVVVDEIDRIQRKDTLAELAEFAKYLSTTLPHVHLVLVGVAKDADALLDGHASNVRTLSLIQLDRMQESELLQVLAQGLAELSLDIEEAARDDLVALSDRSPYYLKLLAREAAEKAIERAALVLTRVDLQAGLRVAADKAAPKLQSEYEVAIASGKGVMTFEDVVHALARLPKVRVSTGEVVAEVEQIARARGDKPVTPARISQALKELSESERRCIVSTERQVWWFTKPMMRTWVRVRMGAT